MKKTFVDVMLELPVDATLRDFLTGTWPVRARNRFAWRRHADASQFLGRSGHGRGPTRMPATGWWPTSWPAFQLGDAAGRQAMFDQKAKNCHEEEKGCEDKEA
jgi:hypothetical protein